MSGSAVRRSPGLGRLRRRPAGAPSLLPLVNVVFLLLIVFLLAGVVAPKGPAGVDPARAGLEGPNVRPGGLGLDGEGRFWNEAGPLAGEALAIRLEEIGTEPLLLTVDRSVEAGVLARALADLQARGVTALRLVLVRGRP